MIRSPFPFHRSRRITGKSSQAKNDSSDIPSAASTASLSSSSLSDFKTDAYEDNEEEYKFSKRISVRHSLSRSAASILHPGRRLSSASSLPWGHRPHPVVGASCLLYGLLVLPLWRLNFSFAALLYAIVTVTSYMSDHVCTGKTSIWHSVDKIVAFSCLFVLLPSFWKTSRNGFFTGMFVPLGCHLIAHAAAKRGDYGGFVFWHTLWHVSGVGLLLVWCSYFAGDGFQ